MIDSPPPRLVADVGGTNVRFALAGSGPHPGPASRFEADDWPDLAAAAAAYLDTLSPSQRPREAAFAVAAPISGDWVEFTNRAWNFSISDMAEQLGLERLEICNDLAAVALALPHLRADELRAIGGGQQMLAAPRLAVAAGTGLGVAGLISTNGQWVAVPSEAGHAAFAPANALERDLLAVLERRFGRVSVERLLSGPGLVNIYVALAELHEGRAPDSNPEPKDVSARARAGEPLALEAIGCFSAILGSVAGDLALTFTARGGVYIGGGVCRRMAPLIDEAVLRRRFEDKGRFQGYMERIPLWLIVAPDPALLGMVRLLDRASTVAAN